MMYTDTVSKLHLKFYRKQILFFLELSEAALWNIMTVCRLVGLSYFSNKDGKLQFHIGAYYTHLSVCYLSVSISAS